MSVMTLLAILWQTVQVGWSLRLPMLERIALALRRSPERELCGKRPPVAKSGNDERSVRCF